MGGRGLSLEEKKTKMLEIFHETAEFFSLKELEKIAPSTPRIFFKVSLLTSETVSYYFRKEGYRVKEVLDELVSDDMVIMDKIGTGNYYWSFPSTAGALKQAAVTKALTGVATVKDKIEETRKALIDASKGREGTAERRKLLSTHSELQSTSASLKSELAAFGAADPVRYEKKSQAIATCKEAAVRWTDNTMVLMQYASGMGAEVEQLRSHLNINEDWEDVKT